MTAGYLVRVEADVHVRNRLRRLNGVLAGDERVRLLGAGYERDDAPLAVRLLCAGTEADARASAQAAVEDAFRALGVDGEPTVVEVDAEPEREVGPPWLVLVEIAETDAADAFDRLGEALRNDGRLVDGSASVGRHEASVTVCFAVDCPRTEVADTAAAVVADALRRAGVEAGTVRASLVFHPDGGLA